MDNEILELYEQVKDKLTIEEFQAKINDISKENEDLGFVDDYYAAEQVVNNIIGASKDDQKSNGEILNIGDLEPGSQAAIVGRIMSISNPKSFKTRKGKSGQVCNMELKDSTGDIRVVLWTENIKLLKNFKEGNIVKITDVTSCISGKFKNGNVIPSIVIPDSTTTIAANNCPVSFVNGFIVFVSSTMQNIANIIIAILQIDLLFFLRTLLLINILLILKIQVLLLVLQI